MPIYLAGILIVILFLVLPFVMFKGLFKFKKITMSKIGMVRFWVGYLAIGLAITFFLGGITALRISDIFVEAAKAISEQVIKLSHEEKAQDLLSFGWAYIAIGFGLFFTGTQFIIDSFDKRKS